MREPRLRRKRRDLALTRVPNLQPDRTHASERGHARHDKKRFPGCGQSASSGLVLTWYLTFSLPLHISRLIDSISRLVHGISRLINDQLVNGIHRLLLEVSAFPGN